MSTAEEKAALRKAKILARSGDRMKLVMGELPKGSSSVTIAPKDEKDFPASVLLSPSPSASLSSTALPSSETGSTTKPTQETSTNILDAALDEVFGRNDKDTMNSDASSSSSSSSAIPTTVTNPTTTTTITRSSTVPSTISSAVLTNVSESTEESSSSSVHADGLRQRYKPSSTIPSSTFSSSSSSTSQENPLLSPPDHITSDTFTTHSKDQKTVPPSSLASIVAPKPLNVVSSKSSATVSSSSSSSSSLTEIAKRAKREKQLQSIEGTLTSMIAPLFAIVCSLAWWKCNLIELEGTEYFTGWGSSSSRSTSNHPMDYLRDTVTQKLFEKNENNPVPQTLPSFGIPSDDEPIGSVLSSSSSISTTASLLPPAWDTLFQNYSYRLLLWISTFPFPFILFTLIMARWIISFLIASIRRCYIPSSTTTDTGNNDPLSSLLNGNLGGLGGNLGQTIGTMLGVGPQIGNTLASLVKLLPKLYRIWSIVSAAFGDIRIFVMVLVFSSILLQSFSSLWLMIH